MKSIMIVAAALVAGMTGASAADLSAPYTKAPPMIAAAYNWSGFYIGVNGGYGWEDRVGNLVATSGGIAIPTAVAGGTIPTRLGVRPEGGFGGGQIGYNWQVGQIVFGVEADIQGGRIRDSVSVSNPGGGGLLPTVNTASSSLDWFGTARARLGYAWNTVMFYGTGGFAYGHTAETVTSQTLVPPPFGAGSNSTSHAGWAAGAGFEWAFAPAWSVKGEYLRIDLGQSTTTASFLPGSADFITYNFRHSYDTARVGINYKFGGPVVARY